MKSEKSKDRIVPKRVLKTLSSVRESGITNMFNVYGVVTVAEYLNHWSGVWLDRYLMKSGKRPKQAGEFNNLMTQFTNYLKEQENEKQNSKPR